MSLKNIIKKFLPEPVERLLRSYYYDKEKFALKNADAVFSVISHKNLWLSEESLSGGGSTLQATQSIRTFLATFIEECAIKTMLDVPLCFLSFLIKICGFPKNPSLVAALRYRQPKVFAHF